LISMIKTLVQVKLLVGDKKEHQIYTNCLEKEITVLMPCGIRVNALLHFNL